MTAEFEVGAGQSPVRRAAILALVLSLLALAGCADTTDTGFGPRLQLTASQAATIRGRVATIAPVHPELAWLADSISLVISAGVEVDSVGLTTNLGGGPFYAVALQRAITLTGLNSSATFDAIFFNDPSNPTDFLIVDGWKQNNSAAIPTSVSGSFNNPQTTQTLNAHFFHVNGTTVTAWRGTAGTATLTSGTTSTNSCLNITALGSATCSTTALTTAFTISTALADNGSALDTKNATLSTTDLPGIRLTFHF